MPPPDYTVHDVWRDHVHLANYADLQQAAGDTFTYLPSEFLREFKNLCWHQVCFRVHGGIRHKEARQQQQQRTSGGKLVRS